MHVKCICEISTSPLTAERALDLVPYGSDPLETLAALMLDRHQAELPDLSRHVALFTSARAIPRFRRTLLRAAHRRGHEGLLAPWCGTLEAWVEAEATDGELSLIDDTERELLLLEALAPHAELRQRFGTWALVDSLLKLFDELNANRRLAVHDSNELATILASGYGEGSAEFELLKSEANLVYSLWTGWNQHLLSQGLCDRSLQRLSTLALRAPTFAARHVYLAGIAELSGSESEWLKWLLARNQLTVVLHGSADKRDGCSAALDRCLRQLELSAPPAEAASERYPLLLEQVYANDTDLAARARGFAATSSKSPARERLSFFAAEDFEHEARAVDLAVRRWRAAGLTEIGIVTHDRKLARRVRALLERAGIEMHDAAGWTLSTTSAATAVMRWIDCIEQDFPQAVLLDFLKSPFLTMGLERNQLDRVVGRLDRDVIRTYNLRTDLRRYRQAVTKASAALERDALGTTAAILHVLDRLAAAAKPLAALQRRVHRSLPDFLAALHQSLEQLGLTETLKVDDAGEQLLNAIRPKRRDLTSGTRFSWSDFLGWLQRELEHRKFRPSAPERGIELLSLQESRCKTFEALVIASCNRDQLPGPLAPSPFFNDGVRQRLGLPTRQERLAPALYDFRRLLESAPKVLLTRRREERGEAQMLSPWVERLLAFHRLAYDLPLDDLELGALLASATTALYSRDAPLPARSQPPAPLLPPDRVPTVITASSHQRLLDCPYQFFAADGLRLRPLEPVREEIEKSDYGKYVHLILQAFHGGLKELPGPWTAGPITPSNRPQAAELLSAIGRAVFANDDHTEQRLGTRGWRYRWHAFIPIYLDWQEQRDRHWRVEATEKVLERRLVVGGHSITLRGRIDRIDRGPEGVSILDYKTGSLPETEAVTAGEHAQLPFYALLYPADIEEVGYVEFKSDRVNASCRLSGEAVKPLADGYETRLGTMLQALYQETAGLAAQGDAVTCQRCDYEGVCRKAMWDAEAKK